MAAYGVAAGGFVNSYLSRFQTLGEKLKYYLWTPDTTVYAHICDKSFTIYTKRHVRNVPKVPS